MKFLIFLLFSFLLFDSSLQQINNTQILTMHIDSLLLEEETLLGVQMLFDFHVQLLKSGTDIVVALIEKSASQKVAEITSEGAIQVAKISTEAAIQVARATGDAAIQVASLEAQTSAGWQGLILKVVIIAAIAYVCYLLVSYFTAKKTKRIVHDRDDEELTTTIDLEISYIAYGAIVNDGINRHELIRIEDNDEIDALMRKYKRCKGIVQLGDDNDEHRLYCLKTYNFLDESQKFYFVLMQKGAQS